MPLITRSPLNKILLPLGKALKNYRKLGLRRALAQAEFHPNKYNIKNLKMPIRLGI
jgi:hypothetical protein